VRIAIDSKPEALDGLAAASCSSRSSARHCAPSPTRLAGTLHKLESELASREGNGLDGGGVARLAIAPHEGRRLKEELDQAKTHSNAPSVTRLEPRRRMTYSMIPDLEPASPKRKPASTSRGGRVRDIAGGDALDRHPG